MGALVHPLAAILLRVLSPLLLLHLHIAAFAFHHLVVTVLVGMLLCISQIAMPLTASFFMGTLHLEVLNSPIIEVVWVESKLTTIDGASVCPFNALSTEQVSTAGLHWGEDQFHTDGTL